jgi:cellulose biosynthesis protein BcsQ
MALGQVITFYSYKGGTGRTMAVANVAYLLAKQHKVLMIDWDLEAPGLNYYFKSSINPLDETSERNGLIELFEEINLLLSEHEEWMNEENATSLLDALQIDRFTIRIVHNHLSLIAAGAFKDGYSEQVTTFQWENLFNRAPWLFRRLAEHLARQYDYIIIDSHTGLSDISGICTALMPEKLVVVFTPNQQSIEGLSKVIRSALKYRKDANDVRPLTLFPLLTRVDFQEKELHEKWRFGSVKDNIKGYQHFFEELIKSEYSLDNCDLTSYFDNIQIQHQAYYAYGEKIAVAESQGTGRLSLSTSYSILSEKLTSNLPPWISQVHSEEIIDPGENRLRAVRLQLQSSLPSEIWRALEQVRKWLKEDPENGDIYNLLLDAVQENPDIQEVVHDLIEKETITGSKAATKALNELPLSIQKLTADADDAYYATEYDQAINLYTKILQLEPSNEHAHIQLAKAQANRIDKTNKSTKNLPREAVQWYRQARSYIAANDIEAATTFLSAAVEAAREQDVRFSEAEDLLVALQNITSKNSAKKPYHYDAFISYSQKDLKWVQSQLLTQLESRNLRVCIDYRDFEPGRSNLREIERAVTESNKTILVLTPGYVKKEWIEFEKILIQASDPTALQRRMIPILLKTCELPARIKLISYLDFTNPQKLMSQFDRLINSISNEI